ncbi:MAG: ABC transporter ATP-binding protein [Acidobacteria bacterium]|nr:MAG: ABC transporter ATP-binding protein [Acidobacteriota bacterium]
MEGPALVLEGLTVRFGRRTILDRLDGSVPGGPIGLLGPNGAGKTTLIHTLLGFHEPTAGTARVLGLDIRNDRREVKRIVGYMPEREAFIADMTAVSFVRQMAELSGLPPRRALERAHEALYAVGLGEVRYRRLGTLSLGMRQMVKLAQAIVHGPKILFLDEPTNGLDPPHRRRMLELIRSIAGTGEVHVVLSSHLLRDVEQTCRHVLILKDGRLAALLDLEKERAADRRFVELETAGRPRVFAEAIERLGADCALAGGDRIKAVLPGSVGVKDLYRIAAELGLAIRRLSFRRDSLEDIFLGVMEGDRGGL